MISEYKLYVQSINVVIMYYMLLISIDLKLTCGG